MLTSSFTGNLGNHMWIYAITRAVAEKNGYKWAFNPSPEFDYYGGKPQMDFMDIDYGEQHAYTYEDTPPWIEHVWREKYERKSYDNGDTVDYHPYQPEVFDIEDNTKLYIRCCQDARYLYPYKDNVAKWFSIKEGNEILYKRSLSFYGINLNEDLCILNVRGGEYKGIHTLLLNQAYWDNAMARMLRRNPRMRFICITDDENYAHRLLDFKMPCLHLGIGNDYYVLNNAKNIILSNSSFAIFPTWLNKNNPYVIAPFGWARHNISTGYWANSDIFTFPWTFLDNRGITHETA